MKETNAYQDELQRRKLQEYIFDLEESRDKAESLAIEHEKLKHSQNLLITILNSTIHGICLYKNNAFAWFNQALTDILGWEQDELIDQSAEILFPDAREYIRISEFIGEASRQGKLIMFEYEYVHKKGHRVPCLVTGRALDKNDPSMGYVFSITDYSVRKRSQRVLKRAYEKIKERTDQIMQINEQLNLEIEERKQTMSALKESEKKYSTFVENSLSGIFIDQSQKILFANNRFAEIYGCPCPSIIGMDSMELVHPDDRAFVKMLTHRRLNGENVPSEYEVRGLRRDGTEICFVRGDAVIEYNGQPAILGSLVDVSLRKKMEEDLKRSEKELRFLSSKLIVVQESERKKIALELHDTIAQNLAVVKLSLSQKLKQMGESTAPPSSGISLETIISLVQNNIEEVRRIMTDLRPSILDDLGILATINWHCREFQEIHTGIRVRKELEIREKCVPDALKVVIFRILQESMNNIVKHAEAKRIRISLRKRDDRIELVIKDNGKGFDVEETLSQVGMKKGMGIIGMKERTELSGGSFFIDSRPADGTCIRVQWQGVS